MRIRDTLDGKDRRLATVSPNATLLEASGSMISNGVGMLVVEAEDGRRLGFLTERDVIAFIAERGPAALGDTVLSARSGMHPAVGPDAAVTNVMTTLTNERRRHAAVVEDGNLVGVVSVGDLLKSRLTEKDQEAGILRDIARGALANAG